MISNRFNPVAVVIVVWGLAGPAAAQAPPFRFVDVTFQRGIQRVVAEPGMGSGVAAADYNQDGLIDFFVPTAGGLADQLYENQGDGMFRDVALAVGVASTDANRVALWFDYDGDATLDLLVASDDPTLPSTYRLYRQDPKRRVFDDVTEQAGLYEPMAEAVSGAVLRHRGGMCVGDINNDGFLDLYAGLWAGAPQLFLNNTDGTFVDITASSGVDTALWYAHQPVMHDFNGDGRQDLFVAIDFLWNVLFLNQGDNTFVDVAPAAGVDNAMNDMGVALGDFDNDGDFDIYITNIFQFLAFNVLLRNDSADGRLRFRETAEAIGVDYGGWGWGCTFLDADNDGWLDIGATNGWSSPTYQDDRSVFYWNRGGAGPKFADVSSAVGFDDADWGSALVAFDYERDGDLDLVQVRMDAPMRLLENTLCGTARPAGARLAVDHHYLVIRPRNAGPNTHAIGATVQVQAGRQRMVRLITAGTSYLGQEPAEAFFGLGAAGRAEQVTVHWPDGSATVLGDVPADQVLTVFRDAAPITVGGRRGEGTAAATSNAAPRRLKRGIDDRVRQRR